MFRKLLIVVSLVLVLSAFVVGLLFSLENDQLMRVSFYVVTVSLPVAVWFFLLLLAGMLIGILTCFGILLRAYHLQRALRHSQRLMQSQQL